MFDGLKVVFNIFKWSVEIIKGESGKSICGLVFFVGFVVVLFFFRRRC